MNAGNALHIGLQPGSFRIYWDDESREYRVALQDLPDV
jgi:hypothetical protein